MSRIIVTTARPLDDGKKEEIVTKAHKKYGEDYAVDFIVDDGIIGGIIIFDGENVFDGSIRTQLQHAKEQLKKD